MKFYPLKVNENTFIKFSERVRLLLGPAIVYCRCSERRNRKMKNENLQDALYSVNSELDSVIDEMIEKYGKFLTLSDVDGKDSYKADLVRSYQALMQRKDYLVNEITVSAD